MESQIQGGKSCSFVHVDLDPGEGITAEAGAMISMDANINVTTRLNGSIFVALIRKFLGGESVFINLFKNATAARQRVTLSQPTLGEVQAMELKGQSICVEMGSYIASTSGIELNVRWAGLASFIAREGMFKLVASGTGTLWFGGYGALLERHVEGELIVDSGHLVAYDTHLTLKAQLSNGLIGSFTSGEGFVTKVIGKGKIIIQTRSLSSFADWINPRL